MNAEPSTPTDHKAEALRPPQHQESQVPEQPWPKVLYARKGPDWVRPPRLSTVNGAAANEPSLEEETYLPVSALLSDEVVERACSRFEELQTAEGFEFAFPESFMREALESAIEQVGGAK